MHFPKLLGMKPRFVKLALFLAETQTSCQGILLNPSSEGVLMSLHENAQE